MPEPFKNLFNATLIDHMGRHLHAADPGFDPQRFAALATDGLEAKELKERSAHIQAALAATLPQDFRKACATILASLSPKTDEDWLAEDIETLGVSGWAIMPMADYVADKGLGDFDHAMDALAELTKRFTSEFAVRPFFIADEARALSHAARWAKDDNYHVRRLASEGARPRLPWGLRLQSFVADPKPLIPILSALRDDPVEYVRRSVANSLNDIAKDHPDLIADLAGEWLKGASKDRVRLVKHACRTLVKAGHPATLNALGYGPPRLDASPISIANADVRMGEGVSFDVEITSLSDAPQPLIIDYVIHHRKANGGTTPKTFKWKIMDLKPGATAALSKTHAIKPITTRVYYSGEHAVELQINGQSFGKAPFTLTV